MRDAVKAMFLLRTERLLRLTNVKRVRANQTQARERLETRLTVCVGARWMKNTIPVTATAVTGSGGGGGKERVGVVRIIRQGLIVSLI